MPPWVWVALAALVALVAALGSGWWQSTREAAQADRLVGPAPGAVEPGEPLAPGASGSGAADPVEPAVADAGNVAAPPSPAALDRAASPAPEPVVAAATSVARPAPAPETQTASVPAAPPTRAAPLPTATELAAQGVSLPGLTLELHVFHQDPASRFVFINGGRFTPGQRLPEGPTVVDIVSDGVVLRHAGREFLLLPQ